MNKFYCIAHKEILYKLPEKTTVIWTADRAAWKGLENVIFLSDISDELYAWHPFLANSAANFAIADIVKKVNVDLVGVNVCIFTYRKFFSYKPLGNRESKFLRGMYLLGSDDYDLSCIDFQRFNEEGRESSFCLAQPVDIKNMYWQYLSIGMNAPDILRYIAIAIDFNVIDEQESFRFLNSRNLIPGGSELGLMPANIYCAVMNDLRRVSFEFLKNHSISKCNPIARRTLANCNERLGSYLLFERYLKGLGRSPFGYLHNISLPGELDYVPGRALN